MNGLMVFGDSAMWREWGMTGLLKRSMKGSVLVVAQWVGRGRDELIP